MTKDEMDRLYDELYWLEASYLLSWFLFFFPPFVQYIYDKISHIDRTGPPALALSLCLLGGIGTFVFNARISCIQERIKADK